MKKILIVDDESAVLRSLRRTLRSTEYNLSFAGGGIEALELSKETFFDMIISDIRMPEIDGFALLAKVRDLTPLTLRVVLSGYNEESLMAKSVINGDVHSYITKPWDNDELKILINHLFTIRDTLQKKELSSIIDRCSHLPVLSETFNTVSKMLDQKKALVEIAEVIAQSPELAVEFLRVANSAYYGSPTGDIKRALVKIGENAIREVLLLIEVSSLSPKNDTFANFLLDHAVTTNSYFHSLYRLLNGKTVPHEISSAGLLHDIGSFIYLANFPEIYKNKGIGIPSELELVDSERSLFSVTHEELTSYLLDWWNFPFLLVALVISHHTPLLSQEKQWRDIGILQLADYYSCPERSTFNSDYIAQLHEQLGLLPAQVKKNLGITEGEDHE